MPDNLLRRQFLAATLASTMAVARGRAQEFGPPREVPWLADIQRPPARLPAGAPQLASVLVDVQGNRVTTVAGWERRREEIRLGWEQFLGTWEYPRRPPEYEIINSDKVGNVTRRLIHYDVERHVPVEAYLLLPARSNQKVPGVVILHSTVDYTIRQGAGLEGDPAAAWGLRLAERGMVAICPRCFLWNGTQPPNFQAEVQRNEERHLHTRGMARMLFDGQRALDLLLTLDEVDPQRLGAAGHSLGAKEALYLAAFDKRVKAAVSSEGGIGIDFSNWDAPWYLGTKVPGHDHHELLAMIAPRAFLLIGGESADGARSWPFIERALEVYRMYGPTSRIGLYNHAQGHRIPPAAEQRVYEWLQTYL
jgi:dienelactone hydrolase